jgi:diguanylate cyclase (GGDEF)-like protein/PAS domain S-box-containing protein
MGKALRASKFGTQPAATGLLMFAAVLLSVVLSHYSGNITALWLANGVVFAWLLPRSPRTWPTHLLAAALGNLAAGLITRFPLPLTLISVWANMAEIFLLLLLTQRFFEAASGKFRISPLRFSLLTLFTVGAVAISCIPLLHYLLGMLLVVSMASLLRRHAFHGAFTRQCRRDTWFCLLLIVGLTGFVFTQNYFPLLFVIISALVMVLFWRGVAVAVLALFLHTMLATSLTIRGMGPIALIPHGTLMGRVIYLQFYLLITLATIYPVGVMLHKKHRLEQLYDLLANNSRDIITRSTVQGIRLYCSPSVQAVLGWQPHELVGEQVEAVIHPDNVADYLDLLACFRDGVESAVFKYRARLKEGGYLEMEARMSMLRDPVTGLPHEIISTSRDVSDRAAAQRKLQAAHDSMERLASMDPLTGLANRRIFDQTLEREWRRALRERTPLALLLLDVDFFKPYNDALGHPAGDYCLRRIAQCMAEIVQRPGDLAARYGGEEFVALLPGTDAAGALHIAHRIAETLELLAIPHPESVTDVLSLSVGVSSMMPDSDATPSALIMAADRALYTAKKNGRNRIEVARAAHQDDAEELAAAISPLFRR